MDELGLAELCRDTARRLRAIVAAETDPELAARLRHIAAEFDRHANRESARQRNRANA
ncbi:MAG: hypothetical protein ACREFQ_12805 [Stellaceae bacterium]